MTPWKKWLSLGLEEDGFGLDWTSRATLSPRRVHARVIAKAPGVWSASALLGEVPEITREFGSLVKVRSHLKDGARLKKGDLVCEMEGDATTLLGVERPFLNIAQYVCGISTQTRAVVDAVEAAAKRKRLESSAVPRVTSTRKTLPGYRELALHALMVGGGVPHRPGLSSGVLIKENHIAACGGIAEAIERARKKAPHVFRIEIEVRDMDELAQALEAGAEIVMLDNFTPAQVSRALKLVSKRSAKSTRPWVEISGGITEATVSEYVQDGVSLISMGSLTHSVKALDLSLLVVG